VLLGFLAQHLAVELTAQTARQDGTRREEICVAGLLTGPKHNRVYGSGQLLVNLPYASPDAGRRAEVALEAALRHGLDRFAERFLPISEFALTAAQATSVTRLEWLKRRLPTLSCTDPQLEAMLERGAGIARWPDDEPAFSCDAIWMGGVPAGFTAVFGPGDLAANHAHARGEFARLDELERFAGAVARILLSFAAIGEHTGIGAT
jgi:acetylornithine deacetylase/succinyl-diaminopimelate desuccinylase-like protein